jgi:hypothetical protein|tara:strand:+ start:970 stop:1161 length:192 start_codon:yes stop_codon:yes gene_type:complete
MVSNLYILRSFDMTNKYSHISDPDDEILKMLPTSWKYGDYNVTFSENTTVEQKVYYLLDRLSS